MTLIKANLKNAIKSALDIGSDASQNLENPVDPDALREQQAGAIATAIDDYIKSATITVPAGIPVSTTGTATAQTGATTSPSGPATIN